MDPNDLASDLRGLLEAQLKERSAIERVSCFSVAVSVPDLPTISVDCGTTRFGGTTQAGPQSLYQIGSNTKAFTAIAVLQLEAAGRLSIEQPIRPYLAAVGLHPPAKWGQLTLRQLLSMTSGLESYDNLLPWAEAYAAAPLEREPVQGLIGLVAEYAPDPMSQPVWHYSNTGYLLAQMIVDQLSPPGTNGYVGAVQRIIDSVGLRDTFYSPHLYPADIAQRIVAGYYMNDDKGLEPLLGQDVSQYSISWAQGAGAMVSNPSDLATWARVLYLDGGRRIPGLGQLQRDELMSLVSMKTGAPLRVPTAADPAGFGLGVGENYDSSFTPDDRLHWFYEGETLGFRALQVYSPYMDFVLCLFANSRPAKSIDALKPLSANLYNAVIAWLT